MSADALLIVDLQNDFCEGGSLGVPGGSQVAAAIADLVRQNGYRHVVATQDWHVDPGAHFSASPDYVDTWPAHCIAGTPGAELHHAVPVDRLDATFRKGEHAAAYSGFEGTTAGPGGDEVPLVDWLQQRGVRSVDVAGIATDHCVRATALDAVAAGLRTRVLLDLTAGVARPTTDRALDQLRAAGVELVGEPVVQG